MKKIYFFLGVVFLFTSVLVLFWGFGRNTFIHIVNASPTSKIEVTAHPILNNGVDSITLVDDSIRQSKSLHDEIKFAMRLRRHQDYTITVKVNKKEVSRRACRIESFALIHIAIGVSNPNGAIVDCISYSRPWDIGYVIGAD